MQDYHWALARDLIHIRPDLVRAAARVLARVLAAASGPFNALHLRSTDWAYNNPDKVAPPDVLTAKAVKVNPGRLPAAQYGPQLERYNISFSCDCNGPIAHLSLSIHMSGLETGLQSGRVQSTLCGSHEGC